MARLSARLDAERQELFYWAFSFERDTEFWTPFVLAWAEALRPTPSPKAPSLTSSSLPNVAIALNQNLGSQFHLHRRLRCTIIGRTTKLSAGIRFSLVCFFLPLLPALTV